MPKRLRKGRFDGALVADVSANSPAQKSGLQTGDIILDINGKPISDSNDLRMKISMMTPDTSVNLKVFRNGAEREIAVKLAELPTTEAAVKHEGNVPAAVRCRVCRSRTSVPARHTISDYR